jgi:hypothetical protein
VFVVCCVGGHVWEELITDSEEPCPVYVCDLETLKIQPRHDLGFSARAKIKSYYEFIDFFFSFRI